MLSQSEFECATMDIKNSIGSAYCKKNGTIVHCNVNFSQKTLKKTILEIRWNEGSTMMMNNYFANIIERTLVQHVHDEFQRSFVLDFWVSANCRNTLACAFNAAILAIIDTGIELSKILHAVDFDCNNEGFAVFHKSERIFTHSFGSYDELVIEKCEQIEKNIRFEIENKYAFKK